MLSEARRLHVRQQEKKIGLSLDLAHWVFLVWDKQNNRKTPTSKALHGRTCQHLNDDIFIARAFPVAPGVQRSWALDPMIFFFLCAPRGYLGAQPRRWTGRHELWVDLTSSIFFSSSSWSWAFLWNCRRSSLWAHVPKCGCSYNYFFVVFSSNAHKIPGNGVSACGVSWESFFPRMWPMPYPWSDPKHSLSMRVHVASNST